MTDGLGRMGRDQRGSLSVSLLRVWLAWIRWEAKALIDIYTVTTREGPHPQPQPHPQTSAT